jgi:hypothetical protein
MVKKARTGKSGVLTFLSKDIAFIVNSTAIAVVALPLHEWCCYITVDPKMPVHS